MTRTGSFILWSSLAVVGAGLALHAVFLFNLTTGRWFAMPPPQGFLMGGANDPAAACAIDLENYCPQPFFLARIQCLHTNIDRVTETCRGVLMGGVEAANAP